MRDVTAQRAASSAIHLSDAEILLSVAAVESAIAIVELNSHTVVFVTDGFKAIVPTLSKNDSWARSLADEPELQAAFDAAVVSAKCNASNELYIGSVKRRVDFKFTDTDRVVVSIRPLETLTTNLHEYMHARDSLFSTSRTISVSEMATTLAHELNTPIGTISNILRGMKLRLKKSDTSIEVLDAALSRALEQTQFTQSVIGRIRDFTQSRRPKHHVLDLREQLTEAVSLLDWMLNHNNCQVQFQMPNEPVYIVGDATMLQQVLINLLRNAVDAMENQEVAQRYIGISVSQKAQRALISITDTGQGLADNTDTLFVPFATNKASGMGVGLNICRSFIELHQGRLWLSPNAEAGCTSFVELPNASDQAIAQRSLP